MTSEIGASADAAFRLPDFTEATDSTVNETSMQQSKDLFMERESAREILFWSLARLVRIIQAARKILVKSALNYVSMNQIT